MGGRFTSQCPNRALQRVCRRCWASLFKLEGDFPEPTQFIVIVVVQLITKTLLTKKPHKVGKWDSISTNQIPLTCFGGDYGPRDVVTLVIPNLARLLHLSLSVASTALQLLNKSPLGSLKSLESVELEYPFDTDGFGDGQLRPEPGNTSIKCIDTHHSTQDMMSTRVKHGAPRQNHRATLPVPTCLFIQLRLYSFRVLVTSSGWELYTYLLSNRKW